MERFYVFQVAQTYTTEQLRNMLHDVELEQHAATALGEPDAGFWAATAELLRAAIPFRAFTDAKRQARRARSRFTKQVREIDYAEIKERIDIVEYIGRYTRLKKSGRGYVGLCPFHSERDGSFWVWPDIKGFRCFGCGVKGDAITFKKLLMERGLD